LGLDALLFTQKVVFWNYKTGFRVYKTGFIVAKHTFYRRTHVKFHLDLITMYLSKNPCLDITNSSSHICIIGFFIP